jgi:hypothetical protein
MLARFDQRKIRVATRRVETDKRFEDFNGPLRAHCCPNIQAACLIGGLRVVFQRQLFPNYLLVGALGVLAAAWATRQAGAGP